MAIFLGTTGNDTIAPDQAPGTAGVRLNGVVQDPNLPLQAALFNGNDNITGDSGDDNLGGGGGIDIVSGEEGDDTLSGGNGFNTLDGGPGNNWTSYHDIAFNLTVNLDDVETELAGGLAFTAFPDIEITVPIDSGFDKSGLAFGLEFGEFFGDTVFAGVGANRATQGFFVHGDTFIGQTIQNVEGALNRQNQIAGNEDDNILIGGNLDDILYGGIEGADLLRAGAGDDSYVVNPGVVGGIADAAGTVIEDTAGIDRLGFFDFPLVTVVASAPTTTPNTIGMARFANDLVLDLNRDGTASAPDDLTIKNFYNSSGQAGSGFIEQLGNLNAQDVLTANLPDMGGLEISWTSPSPIPGSTDPGTTDPLVDLDGTLIESRVYFDPVSGITSYVFTNNGETADLNTLTGSERDLYTQALNGHDVVNGTINGDNINGNRGDDIINGGAGDDGDRTVTIPANEVRTALRGGRGGDQVFGEAGSDILNGNEDDDQVNGGDGDDIVRGGKGNDIVIGGNGADFLFGDNGQDILIGGLGTGDGKDGAQDVFELKDPGVADPADADLIRGFENGTDLMLLPTGVTFSDLTINPIQLSIDSGVTVQSSQILQSGQTLALVEGVIPNDLDASDFTGMGNTVLAGGSLTNEQIALFGQV